MEPYEELKLFKNYHSLLNHKEKNLPFEVVYVRYYLYLINKFTNKQKVNDWLAKTCPKKGPFIIQKQQVWKMLLLDYENLLFDSEPNYNVFIIRRTLVNYYYKKYHYAQMCKMNFRFLELDTNLKGDA